MGYSLSEQLKVTIPILTLDIGATDTATIEGGTAAANHWIDMSKFGRALFIGRLGGGAAAAWEAGDDLLTITIQQATDSSGTGLATVKAFTVTDGDLNAEGDTFTVEVQASELNVASGYTHVRLKAAATDNNGVDELTVVCVQSEPRYSDVAKDSYTKQYPQDQAAN